MASSLPPRFTASVYGTNKKTSTFNMFDADMHEFAETVNGKKRFLLNPALLKRSAWDDIFSGKFITISIGLHIVVGIVALLLFYLSQLLGWHLTFFDIKTETPKDVTFVITNNTKPEKPRDPNTKNRSTVSSRSGGEKSQTHQGEEHQATGASGGKPVPTKPQESSSKPTPTVTQQQSAPAPTVVQHQPTRHKTVRKPSKIKTVAPTPIAVERPIAKAVRSHPKNATKAPVILDSDLSEDFEPPAPILTKPAKAVIAGGGGTGSASGTAGKRSVRLGPDQIGSATARPSSMGGRGQGGKSSYSNPASSGGGKGLAGVDALADFDFGPYIASVTQRIKRNFNPPSKDDSLKAVVLFSIARSGSVSGVRILRSSGLPMFDDAALSAIRVSSPFRSFPPEASKSSIQMEFTFDYLGAHG
jgi:protein TonB